jgi:signal transduction histidine kinase
MSAKILYITIFATFRAFAQDGAEQYYQIPKSMALFLTIFLILLTGFAIYIFFVNRKLKNLVAKTKSQIEEVKKIKAKKEEIISKAISATSHHWRQPLNTLSMLTDLLIMRFEQNRLDEEFLQYFHTKSKEHIKQINDSIDVLRTFNLKEKKESFDLIPLIKEFLERQKINYPDIMFKLNAPSSLKITNYKKALLDTLKHLIQNSAKALEEADKKEIAINIKEEKDRVVIEVSDSAKGIDSKIMEKIFEPYFSTKEDSSAGVGLFFVKTFITYHLNGTIEAFNDNGAHIKMTFPKEIE